MDRFHEKLNDAGISQCKFLRVNRGQGLRRDFSKDQDQNGEDTRGDSGTGASPHPGGQRCGQGCGIEIYDVVSDQYGGKHLAGIVRNAENPRGAFVTVLRARAKPDFIGCRQSGLRGRKECR